MAQNIMGYPVKKAYEKDLWLADRLCPLFNYFTPSCIYLSNLLSPQVYVYTMVNKMVGISYLKSNRKIYTTNAAIINHIEWLPHKFDETGIVIDMVLD